MRGKMLNWHGIMLRPEEILVFGLILGVGLALFFDHIMNKIVSYIKKGDVHDNPLVR